MSANIKATNTEAIIGVGGEDQMTVSNAGVVTANSFVGAMNGSIATATGSTTARTLANRFADVINVKDFLCSDGLPVAGDGVHDDTTGIQAAINYGETLVEQISPNYDIATATVYIPAGRYKHTGLLLSQSVDGCSLIGQGAGVSVLEYSGSSIGLKVGTEVGSPNFSHVWIKDLTFRGGNPPFTNDANIVIGSIGIQFNRMIRNCGMVNCQILGHDINVQLRDCWTFKIRDSHIHDAKTHQVEWQTALNGEITGCRFDDSDDALVVIDGQGTSNQVRTFRMAGNVFQECTRKPLIFKDVSSAYLESNYFENNNQGNVGNHYEISFLKGTSNIKDGTFTLVNNYYSPGSATWTQTERAVYVESARYIQIIGDKTGSSVYNTYLETGSDVIHVDILGAVFTNMNSNTAVTRGSSTTSINEVWSRIDSSYDIIDSINRKTFESRSRLENLSLNYQISSTTSSITTNSSRTFFNMAGNNQTLTLNTADAVDGRSIFVRKYSVSGTLTVETQNSDQISLNGVTNNKAVLSAARGAAWFVYDGTDWICLPTEEAAGWVLAA